MSFRIDDILKKESDNFKNSPEIQAPQFNPGDRQYYCRSLSEPHPWGADFRYRSNPFCDPYTSRAISYNLYARSPIWTAYSPYSCLTQYYHFSKRKGGQVRFTATQTDTLEKRFNSHKYLSPEDRKILADSLKLTDRQVKTWFQNRRAKWRRSNSTSSSESDITSSKFEETKTG